MKKLLLLGTLLLSSSGFAANQAYKDFAPAQPAAAALAGTEPIVTVQSAATVKTTPAALSTYIESQLTSADVISKWSGTCNVSAFLRGDGACAPFTSGTVTSVALTTPSWLTVAGSPITTSGTLAVSATTGQTANSFLATPDGTTGAVTLRTIVLADIPTIPLATKVSGTLPVANGGTNLTAATDDQTMVGNGTTWQSKAIPNCGSSTQALAYDTSTNTFSCQTVTGSGGTPAGSTTQVQFNNAGAFGADAGFAYDSSTDTATFGVFNGTGTIKGEDGPASGNGGGALIIRAGNKNSGGGGAPGALTLSGGAGTGGGATGGATTVQGGDGASSSNGGALTLRGGDPTAGTGQSGGAVTLRGGNGASGGGNGANVTIAGGTAGGGSAGTVVLQTGGSDRVTVSGAGDVTSTGIQTISATEPRQRFNATGGGTDGKLFDIDVTPTLFSMRTRTDADGAGVTFFSAARTASSTAISTMTIGSGANISTLYSNTGVHTFSGPTSTSYSLVTGSVIPVTGTYRPGTNRLGFSSNSALRGEFDANGALILNGANISAGTKFTASGCSNSTTVGGATAGQFASGTTGACTVTITLPTSTNGWACHASDITTPANLISQSAVTTTSCTITGTTVTGDTIVFSAHGY